MDEKIILEALEKMESGGLVEHLDGNLYRLTTAGLVYAHTLLRSKPEAWILLNRLLRNTMNPEDALETLTTTVLTVFFNLNPEEARNLLTEVDTSG